MVTETRSMRALLTLLLAVCVNGLPLFADGQATRGGGPPRPDLAVSASPPAAARVPAAAPRPPAEKRAGQAASIRIELKLIDRNVERVIAEEQLDALLADLELGRVRRRNGPAAGQPQVGTMSAHRAFEVDLTPEIVGEKIKVTLALSYMAPAGANGDDDKSAVALSQNLTAFLENGKPTILVESTGDQATARRVIVQATATIVR